MAGEGTSTLGHRYETRSFLPYPRTYVLSYVYVAPEGLVHTYPNHELAHDPFSDAQHTLSSRAKRDS
jgi:hypothetical protein